VLLPRARSADGKPRGASAKYDKYDALLTKVAAPWDGKLIVAGDYSGRIQIWDGQKSSTVGTLAASVGVAVSSGLTLLE